MLEISTGPDSESDSESGFSILLLSQVQCLIQTISSLEFSNVNQVQGLSQTQELSNLIYNLSQLQGLTLILDDLDLC